MASKIESARTYVHSNYGATGRLRFDELSRKIQILSPLSHVGEDGQRGEVWRDLTDKDICTMVCNCAEETGQNISDREIRTVLGSEDVPTVHPLRDWLHSLPPYDPQGIDWIDMVASQVHVEKLHTQGRWQRCFKKWFVAMVASWMEDEVVNHQVLVLIGRQGIYKTTWLERLVPPQLRAYVTKLASTRELSKDDRIRVAEFGMINMDEIDSMSARELNMLKSVITTSDVNERAAYGHTKERRVRCASFCASGNNRQFLTDDTGNRRWLPFAVESIDNPFTHPLQYEWLYSQAVWLIENHYEYWFDLDEIAEMEKHNEEYKVTRNEDELLCLYFTPAQPGDTDAKFMSASEIHSRLKVSGNIERPMPLNLFGQLLQRKGFEKRKRIGRPGYLVNEIKNVYEQQTLLAHQVDDPS